MINWDFRDTVLRAVYDLNSSFPGVIQIKKHLGDSAHGEEEIGGALSWLREQGLVTGETSWGGGVLWVKTTPLGTNFVEMGTPVQELAKAAVQGSIINAQTNYNHGTAMNVMGDHNTSTQNINNTSAIDEVITALREANEVEKADELQQEADQNGVPAALKKAAGWIGTNAIAAPVIGQIAPIVFAALGM